MANLVPESLTTAACNVRGAFEAEISARDREVWGDTTSAADSRSFNSGGPGPRCGN